jgi:UDP-2,3-diacylglucosamine hydrolase
MTKAYVAVDRLGATRFAHQHFFPRKTTVERAMHYLDSACPDWRAVTRHCYFGHTHQPFSNFRHAGINFHNTGSAIRGMGFNPLTFSSAAGSVVPLS